MLGIKTIHCDDRKQSRATSEIASFHSVLVASDAGYSNYPDLILHKTL